VAVSRLRRVPFVVALLVLAGGCSLGGERADAPGPGAAAATPTPSAASARPAPGALAWKGCDGSFECASFAVPLSYASSAGGTLDLAVVRKKATGPGARIGSLVVNPGGPGESAVGYLERAYAGLPGAVRARFDLVAFDPRGVGRSAPVRCGTTAQLDAYFHLDPQPDTPAELTAYVAADRALAQGCAARSARVLPHVSTADAAEDMDRLRAALGDARLTYLGYSYGTAIGAAYLEAHPRSVRAMVLDGAIDPALTWDGLLAGQSTGFDRAFEAFLADCERTSCAFRRAATGDLGAAFDALAQRVDRAELPGEGRRTVGPGELTLGVGAGLYNRQYGWPAIASALAAAQGGDGRALLSLSDSYLERRADGYENVQEANLAVNCIDRPWPRGTAPYTALADKVRATAPRFGPAIVLSGLACATWTVPSAGRPHAVRAEGAPPVVVIGTTRDPATPYVWAQALAGQLASGVLLTHEGDGHTVYRAGAPACILGPVDRYLLTTQAPAAARC
jgi:pimeloyl-ACP methyl ester carboxylesterase